MVSRDNYLAIIKAESVLATNTLALNERKAAIVLLKIESNYPSEYNTLIQNKSFTIAEDENEDEFAGSSDEFKSLFIEYKRLLQLIYEEKHKSTFFAKMRNFILSKLDKLNVYALKGIILGNILNAIGIIATSIVTAATFVGTLAILAFALPVSLSTLLLGVGIEFISALFNPETPLRKTILALDFGILAFASVGFMIAIGVISVTLPVLPLIFIAITEFSYIKDYQKISHKVNQIKENNNEIGALKGQLFNYIKTYLPTQDVGSIKKDPIVLDLSLKIAQLERENAILKIQCKTLNKALTLHLISLIAPVILIASAFIFPPLGLGVFIAGAIALGIFTKTLTQGMENRKQEQQTITTLERTILGQKQTEAIENAVSKRTAELEAQQRTAQQLLEAPQDKPKDLSQKIVDFCASNLPSLSIFGSRSPQSPVSPAHVHSEEKAQPKLF